ncbi:MAG: helix-turn-helix domain-containing protein [Spirochaetia bacterium]
MMDDPADFSDPPVMVRTSGHIFGNPRHSTPGTKLDDYMLTVFIGGRGYYKRRAGTVNIRPPVIGIVPPRDEGLIFSDTEDPYDHYYCRFTGNYGKLLAEEILRRRGKRFFADECALEAADLIRKTGKCYRRSLPPVIGIEEVCLLRILVMLRGESSLSEQREFSAEALSVFLEERVDRKTDIAKTADFFSMSPSTLCRRVKAATGSSVQKIHERIKMEWAMSLLSLGGLRVGEAADRLGYSDPFYFSRVFSKHTGMSPKQWQLKNCR